MSFIKSPRTVFAEKKGNRLYSKVRTPLKPGEYTEYYYPPDTCILSRDDSWKCFAEKPYLVIPSEGHYLLVVPSWVPVRAGFLVYQSPGWRVYRVDFYAYWAGLIPEELRGEFKLEPTFKTIRVYGRLVTGSPEELDRLWDRLRGHLLRREEEGIRVKRGHVFPLMVELVKMGVLPFTPTPVRFRDVWKTDIVLRDYQEEALTFFQERGNVVVLWPPGAGKTYFAVHLIARLSGKTLIVTPTLSLADQWYRVLKEHLFGARVGAWHESMKVEGDVTVTTYQSAPYFRDRGFELIVLDECQHLPSNVFSQIAGFKTKYRLGLTASPYREDGREALIYALCGFPYGANWHELVEREVVRKPTVTVVKTWNKYSALKQVLGMLKGPTLIFCDSIGLGKALERELGIPFVYGEHSLRERLKVVEESERVICSRIFDEGMDLPDIRNVVEVDFLGGSRRQSLQRVGRLMHSRYKGLKHYILMTPEELERYGKRLYSLYERDFTVKFIEA